jgi:hypothetical protein
MSHFCGDRWPQSGVQFIRKLRFLTFVFKKRLEVCFLYVGLLPSFASVVEAHLSDHCAKSERNFRYVTIHKRGCASSPDWF